MRKKFATVFLATERGGGSSIWHFSGDVIFESPLLFTKTTGIPASQHLTLHIDGNGR